MSQDTVELVKRTLAALQRALEAYWREPRPVLQAYDDGELWPEWEEWFALVHPNVEWRTVFVGDTFYGHRDCVRVWNDFLRSWRDYRVTLEDIEDLGGGHVFMVLTVSGLPKETDARVSTHFYSLASVRDGQVARLAEYTSRDDALEEARQLKRS